MPDPTQQQIADQLLSGNFTKSGPVVTQLSDPLVDTPMVVTIDQLKPYDLNPRIVKNPLFDDIKASIRERGLDAPPAITRRPGETHYIIRNGGNTRLQILHELWTETKNERFFKINCLFRPWQNEIVVLTGHLVENELHGQLTFIERAIAIQKLYELYRNTYDYTLTQKQLAEKLTNQGYPTSEYSVSRMLESVNFLLPYISNALYGGMSRKLVDRILRLRRSAKLIFLKYKAEAKNTAKTKKANSLQFDEIFTNVLSSMDVSLDEFKFEKLQDELVGQLSQILSCSYDRLAYDLSEKETRQRMIESPPSPPMEIDEATLLNKKNGSNKSTAIEDKDILALPIQAVVKEPSVKVTRTKLNVTETSGDDKASTSGNGLEANDEQDQQGLIDAHILSPTETTPRLDAIEGLLGELTDEAKQDFKTNVIQSVPVQAGGLYPISDIWHISSNLDTPEQLRIQIGQLVLEIADEWGLTHCIETTDTDLGFRYISVPKATDNQSKEFLLSFIKGLASPNECNQLRSDYQNAIITGCNPIMDVLSDVAFVKLMRVYRLLRRLWQLQLKQA